MSTPAHVELQDVSLRYVTVDGETEALRGLSLSVERGEFVALVGPSGCGKSTVLSLIAGLLQPAGGRVLVGGQDVTGPSRQIGYMLQQDYLFPWRDVLGNVLIGLELQGKLKGQAKRDVVQRATDLLNRYGLAGFHRHRPAQLSGGMRQRVALVRTLATDPQVVLLDEPFSALDSQTRLALQDEVAGILRREGKTVLLVTHDIREALAMSDRVVVLSRRPGRVKAEFPAEQRHYDAIWRELDAHVAC